MIKQIFTIFDSATQAYMIPFFDLHEGSARRQFGDLVNDPEHPFSKHPDDYTLYFIGIYNEDTGHVEAHDPKSLGNGIEYMNKDRME